MERFEGAIPTTADEIEPIIREAGVIAMSYYGRVTGEKKADGSCVTEADRAVEDFLVSALQKRFPDHAFLGEERGIQGAAGGGWMWAIDPIDGTAGFLTQLPTWSISVGLLWQSTPILGAVYLPTTDEMFLGDEGGGARFNGRTIRAMHGCEVDRDASLLWYSRAHLELSATWPGFIWGIESAAATLCYVARGTILAGVLDKVGSYDLAAGLAILHYAGGSLSYLDSGEEVDIQPFLLNGRAPGPMLACHPESSAGVRRCFVAVSS